MGELFSLERRGCSYTTTDSKEPWAGKRADRGWMEGEASRGWKRPIGYSSNDDDNDGDDNQRPMHPCRTRFAALTAMTNDAVRPLNWYHLLIGTSNFYRSVYQLSRDKIIARHTSRPILLRSRNNSHAADCLTISRVRHSGDQCGNTTAVLVGWISLMF